MKTNIFLMLIICATFGLLGFGIASNLGASEYKDEVDRNLELRCQYLLIEDLTAKNEKLLREVDRLVRKVEVLVNTANKLYDENNLLYDNLNYCEGQNAEGK